MIDRDAIVADLVTEDVTLVQTLISWVLLGPADVFKLKKSARLGFLDFSTLERRKAACEAEIALNRRLAPDTYLGVVPVTRDTKGRLAIDGEGEVVEWAVHMRRLPERDRADVRLAEGRLSADDIERIAARLALFHAMARCDVATAAFGRPAHGARHVFNSARMHRGMRPPLKSSI